MTYMKPRHSHLIPAMFGADMIIGPSANRTDSGYYPNYPMMRGYASGYYRVSAPPSDIATTDREAKARGFRFSLDCKQFIVLNKWSALRWAYQLGLFYRPQFGPIDNHFFRAIDPNKKCVDFLQLDYKKLFQVWNPKTIKFFLEITLHYFRGLLQSGHIPYEILRMRFDDLLKLSISYGIKPRVIGRLYPLSQAAIAQEAAQKQILGTHPTTTMSNTPSAQMNPFTGTYDYSGLGTFALQYGL